MAKEERLRIIVHGRVQGVFFRSNAEDVAKKLGLKGYVRNTPEGNVEVVAEGAKENLKALLEWCKKGPVIAHVGKVDIQWSAATGEFEDFSTKY
jgi:acylphosphatase